MAADECTHVRFGTENTWMSGNAPASRYYMSVSGSSGEESSGILGRGV